VACEADRGGLRDPRRHPDPHRPQRHRPALLLRQAQAARHEPPGIADARGNLLWISGAIRGAIHDTKAARIWQIPRLLAEHGLFALGDKGYDGLDHDLVATPFKGKGKPEWQKEYNRLHARLRGPGERMFAQLKQWAILDQVRCDPAEVTQLAKPSKSSPTTNTDHDETGSVRRASP
jgi:hypothetical protein